MKRNIKILIKLFSHVLIIAVLLITNACLFSNYKEFTWEKTPAHFSFQYSRQYSVDTSNIDSKFPTVWFEKPRGQVDLLDIIFSVSLYQSTSTTTEELDKIFSGQKELYSDTQVIERSSITVDAEQAEQTVYSYTFASIYGDGLLYKPALIPQIGRIVVFKHVGVVWSIEISSEEHNANSAKADLDHILQTFKILD